MAAGPSEKVTRVFLMNPEELSKWLRKTAFTFCYEVPESSEGLETEIRTVLMEVDDRTEDKWDDLDPVGTVNLTPAQRFGPNLGGEDVTVSLPVSEEEINRERKTAERSVTLSEKSESIRAAEKAKKEQATKKPKFEFPKIYTQQDVLARSTRGDASVARAPGKSLPVVPPTDIEMAKAVEARIPDEEEDMQGDTNTEAPAPSIDSTVKSEEIVMGRVPEKRKLGDRFFRASVVSSQVSSTLDTQAEEQLRREEIGRNPDAASSGHRRPPSGCPWSPATSSASATTSGRSGERPIWRPWIHCRMRLERREPSAGIVDLPAPPPVPDAPEPPEFAIWAEQQRRDREKGRKGDGKGKTGGKGKKGRGDGGKGGDGRDRARTPPTR